MLEKWNVRETFGQNMTKKIQTLPLFSFFFVCVCVCVCTDLLIGVSSNPYLFLFLRTLKNNV
jgi:hypothetical protein